MRYILITASLALLSACGQEPQVVDGYNGFSVRVAAQGRDVDDATRANAQRICASRGMNAEYASTSYTGYGAGSHLFLCLNNVPPLQGATGAPLNAAHKAYGAGQYFSSAGTM